jgi:hypothetical protein
MAHKMAHRRSGAFHAPNEEPGEPLLELRSAFLRAVEDVCPQAMHDYRGLLEHDSPEAIAAWASKYHLSANWCIEAALAGLRIARNGGPLRPFIVGVWPAADRPPPGETIPVAMEYSWIAYTGEVDPSVFRKRHLAAFTKKLDAQIASAVKRLEERKAAGELLRDGFIQDQTWDAIPDAARWQTCKVQTSTRDAKTLRRILKRIGLKPRPGLV